MPIPILPPPPAAAPADAQPYYVRDTQGWSVEQERQRHNQALFSVGEYAMFALMWHLEDFLAGLVGRCTTCTGAPGSKQAIIQASYNQPTKNRCPNCYGTTFEGGYRALIVRPAIFSDTDESEALQARGIVNPSDIDVESTTDFRVRSNDYVFRSNNDRYQLGVPARIQLRTGFGPVTQTAAAIGYNHARASYENPSASVAYDIPPNGATLSNILIRGRFTPADFTDYEVIRGPLIPAGE